jgi:drug/metabolite transporter (DMT)-like permease
MKDVPNDSNTSFRDWLPVVLFVIGVICFFGGGFHGGMAIAGKTEAGHYYVGNGGRFIEVSRHQFVLSALLSLGFSVFMVAWFSLGFLRDRARETPRKRKMPLLAWLFLCLVACGIALKCFFALSAATDWW